MTFYQTVDGREAIHIGYNPEVGKETFRVGNELVFTDKDGCIAGLPFIEKQDGYVLVMFNNGTWRKYTDTETYNKETNGEDIFKEAWILGSEDSDV